VQFVVWLSECVARPVERHHRESSIPLEAARLLLNLAIINTDTLQSVLLSNRDGPSISNMLRTIEVSPNCSH